MNVHYSSNSNEWSTPQNLFNYLDNIYHFTLDPCSTKDNAKCNKYYTIDEDGLSKDWSRDTVFMNPPYGRGIKHWIEKAYMESQKGAIVVALIPSRTDTSYWHSYCMKSDKIIFLKGRVKFNGSKKTAPFPSAIVVFKPGDRVPTIECMDVIN